MDFFSLSLADGTLEGLLTIDDLFEFFFPADGILR